MKTKYKTIKISESVHEEIKKACNRYGQKLGWWCEVALLNSMVEWDNNNLQGPLRCMKEGMEKNKRMS